MKQLFTFSCLMIFILCVDSAYPADLQEGFMGIKWGAAVSTAGDLQEVRRTANIDYYIRPDELYTLNDMKLGQPIYGFFHNQFFAVFIRLDPGIRVDEIKGFLDAVYGPARAQLRYAQVIYIYDYQDIKIKLKHYETEKTYKLGFYYTPLSTRVNESRLEKNFEIILPIKPSPLND